MGDVNFGNILANVRSSVTNVTDSTLPRMDGTTGKVIQDSGVTLDDTDVMTFTSGGNVITISPQLARMRVQSGGQACNYTATAGVGVRNNRLAFHLQANSLLGLGFMTGPLRYLFTDTSGADLMDLNISSGMLTLTDGVNTDRLQPGFGLRVITGFPAFVSDSFPLSGMFIDTAALGPAIEVRDTGGTVIAGFPLPNAGTLALLETTTPGSTANYGKIYTKNDNKFYVQTGDGVEHQLLNENDNEDVLGEWNFSRNITIGGTPASGNARLEIIDNGTAKGRILKITQDNEDIPGIVIGNDTFSTTDIVGMILSVSNSGQCDIDSTGLGTALRLMSIGTTRFEINATGLGFFNVTPVARAAAYTPTNVKPDRSYDANATTVEELADVLGTLIADFQAYGLLQ